MFAVTKPNFFKLLPNVSVYCNVAPLAREVSRRGNSKRGVTMAAAGKDLQTQQDTSLRIAKEYMELSSSHELDKVFPLFARDAVYESESLRGSWTGIDDIESMMRPFFDKYPDVTWEVRRMFVTEQPGSTAAGQGAAGQQQQQPDAAALAALPRKAGVVHVEVHFIRRWTETDGAKMESPGREWISVDAKQERIVYVYVSRLGSFWNFW